MRHRAALALACGAALALAGCARPTGVDNDLTDDWPAFAKAITPVPVVGACYSTPLNDTWYGDFSSSVDCTKSAHETETVFVGSFSGADADRSAPPLAGSASRRSAYDQCQKAATDYLGGAWQGAKIDLGLVLPDDKAWAGGARWYRCDVTQYLDSSYDKVSTNGSVKDGLRGAKPLAVTCLVVTDDGKSSITKIEDIGCDKPHNGEFIGLYTAPDKPWPADKNARSDIAQNGCEKLLGQFLGYGNGKPYSNYVGWWPGGFAEEQWKLGDRTERCYALAFNGHTVNGVRVVGSMRGLKSAAPHRA
jgi:hypothetical protein